MPKTATNPISEEADRQRRLLSAIDEGLIAAASEGRRLSEDEQILLEAAGWPAEKIEKERSRCARVAAARDKAGTADGRERAEIAADSSAALAAGEGRRLRAEAAALEQQARDLDRSAADDRRRFDAMVTAVDVLRELVPEHVRRRHNSLKRIAREQFVPQISELESRIRQYEWFSSLRGDELMEALHQNPVTKARCLNAEVDAGPHDRVYVNQSGPRRMRYSLNEAWFREFLDELDVDGARDDLPRLRAELDAALELADAILDHYVV